MKTIQSSTKNENLKSNLLSKLSTSEILGFLIVGLVIFFLPLLFTLKTFFPSFKETGPIGDTIGGITAPFLSFFGSILVYLALKAQVDANELVQKQFAEQQMSEYRQNFENTFFNLITVHHSIVENIDYQLISLIKYDDELEQYFKLNSTYENIYKDITDETTIISRDFFKQTIELLKYLLEDDLIFEKEINDTFYYNKFKTEKELFEKLKAEKKLIVFNNVKIESKFSDIYKRLYLKLNTDLGHYFRNLYRIIKLVDEKQFDSDMVDNFKIQYSYTSIIRSQLSDFEVHWVFFNCLSENGSEKFKPLIEKYTIFKNIYLEDECLKFYKSLYADTAFVKPSEADLEQHLLSF